MPKRNAIDRSVRKRIQAMPKNPGRIRDVLDAAERLFGGRNA